MAQRSPSDHSSAHIGFGMYTRRSAPTLSYRPSRSSVSSVLTSGQRTSSPAASCLLSFALCLMYLAGRMLIPV